jgi:hypothetical protein
MNCYSTKVQFKHCSNKKTKTKTKNLAGHRKNSGGRSSFAATISVFQKRPKDGGTGPRHSKDWRQNEICEIYLRWNKCAF